MGDSDTTGNHHGAATSGTVASPGGAALPLRDAHAFGEVVRRSHGAIYLTALAIVRDADTAHDITQETFLRAWLKVDTLRDASLIQPWLGSIARNLAAQWLRTGQQRSRVLPLISMEEITVEPADNTRPNPRQAAGRAEEKGQLTDAVMALPDDLRQAVLLHYAEGMSPSDIARLNGEAPSTVTRRLDKARQVLRQHLESGLAANLAASVQQLRPGQASLQRTLGIITAATALPAVTRAQLLQLVANTPPPPLIDPVTSAATAAQLKGTGIMNSIIAKAGAGKILAAGAAAVIIIGGGAYAVESLTSYDTSHDKANLKEATVQRSAINAVDKNTASGALKIEDSRKKQSGSTSGAAAGKTANRRLSPEERTALLAGDTISTHPQLVVNEGETSGKIYFNMEVVDESGLPIEGAKVEIFSITAAVKRGGGSWWFQTEPKAIVTNSKGIARPYVRQFCKEQLATGGAIAQVHHNDFASTRTVFDFSAPKKIVLRRGDSVIVYAYDENSSTPITAGVKPTFGPSFNEGGDVDYMYRNADGAIILHKINAKKIGFYLTGTDDDGRKLISDFQTVNFPRNRDEPLHVTLRKSFSVKGTLSSNVTRPVTNGKVIAAHISDGPICGAFQYQEHTINEDGTFELTEMPAGEIMIWSIADGYCSINGNVSSGSGSPQRFLLTENNQRYKLPMEQTAAAIVRLVDVDGKPVTGAKVSTAPNMCYENCCGIWGNLKYDAESDSNGVALIRNIPPLDRSTFSVSGGWQLPPVSGGGGSINRRVVYNLSPGETLEETLTVYPEGSTVITQEDGKITTASGTL